MRTLVLAAFILLTMVAPSTPLVDEAEARPPPPQCVREPCGPICVIGSDSDCVVRIVCVTDPCNPRRLP